MLSGVMLWLLYAVSQGRLSTGELVALMYATHQFFGHLMYNSGRLVNMRRFFRKNHLRNCTTPKRYKQPQKKAELRP